MKTSALLLLIITSVNLPLSGCSTTTVASPPRIVEVPVAIQAPPPVIPRPSLAIENITKTSSSTDVVRLYRETVDTLISYSQTLETALDAYRTPEK